MTLQPGLRGEASLVVDASVTADQGGRGAAGVQVLGTPFMIALMETAAFQAVQPHLPPGMVTVGTVVNVRHLAPTPLGMTVTARAELTAVDGRRLVFRVWAEDAAEAVGEGTHERWVAPLDRLLERARAKAAKGGEGA